jgi:hypothetical protein
MGVYTGRIHALIRSSIVQRSAQPFIGVGVKNGVNAARRQPPTLYTPYTPLWRRSSLRPAQEEPEDSCGRGLVAFVHRTRGVR